jgi:hypothetical protein
VAQLVEATSRKAAGSIPDQVIGFFLLSWSFRPHYEYQECFLGVKFAGALGWQPYHLHVPIVLKSGSLYLLESSGPIQACNGIALPLPLPMYATCSDKKFQRLRTSYPVLFLCPYIRYLWLKSSLTSKLLFCIVSFINGHFGFRYIYFVINKARLSLITRNH